MDEAQIKWRDFINAKYLAFEAGLKRKSNITEFTEAIGHNIYQGDVSYWLKGGRIPGVTIVKRLARSPLIGPGVWDAAGLIKPESDDPDIRTVVVEMEQLPQDQRKDVAEAVSNPLLRQTLASLAKMPPHMQERFAELIENRSREIQEKREESNNEDDQAGSPAFSFAAA